MRPLKKSLGSADLEDCEGLQVPGEEQNAGTSTREVHAFRDEENTNANSSRYSHGPLVAAPERQEPKNTMVNLYQYGKPYERRYVQERRRTPPERPAMPLEKRKASSDQRHSQDKQRISPNRLSLSPDRRSKSHSRSLVNKRSPSGTRKRSREETHQTVSDHKDSNATMWIIVICAIISVIAALYLSFNLGVTMAMKKAGNL